ncbi:SCR-like protein [Medicago truncatula]|uniref:SCR-like protein n=1 Tax=Medicago truncatula TaxID=3880 RepID=A0A072U678_MEDTR|nr:SCR-like protein [Medicago truncatula]
MMKLGGRIFLSIGILFALFSLNYGSGGVMQKDDFIHLCQQSMTLSGQCHESSPSEYDIEWTMLHMDQSTFALVTCFDVFNTKYGASAMAQRCTCQNLSQDKHICSCCINCEHTDGKSRC